MEAHSLASSAGCDVDAALGLVFHRLAAYLAGFHASTHMELCSHSHAWPDHNRSALHGNANAIKVSLKAHPVAGSSIFTLNGLDVSWFAPNPILGCGVGGWGVVGR